MYGCRRSPNRRLNHTNLICGWGNQITCFGFSADDEFIFVTKLSRQRKRGAEEMEWICVCVCVLYWVTVKISKQRNLPWGLMCAVLCQLSEFAVSKKHEVFRIFDNTNNTSFVSSKCKQLKQAWVSLWNSYKKKCQKMLASRACVHFYGSWTAWHQCLKTQNFIWLQ